METSKSKTYVGVRITRKQGKLAFAQFVHSVLFFVHPNAGAAK